MISPQENDSRIALAGGQQQDGSRVRKIGKERTANSAVRTFADAMVVEHQKCVNDLKAIAKAKKDDRLSTSSIRDANGKKSLGDTTPDRRRTAVLIQDDGKSRDSHVIFHPTDFLAVHEDISNHLHSKMKKEWEGVSAEEFDRAVHET